MFNKLREANVDYIQGYQVGKPVAIETLIEDDQTDLDHAGNA
jgi:EAL domain-containing protein (putative c-di-GMP-specific phosphodiesterase class I)